MRLTKIFLFTVMASALLFCALWLGAFATSALVSILAGVAGIELSYSLTIWGGFVLFFGALFVMPRDWLAWNGKYCVEGETIIEAPIEEVWDNLQLRPRDNYFNTVTRSIRAVPGKPDEFKLMFDQRLIGADAQAPDHIHVRLLDEEKYEYIAFHALNAHRMPLFGKDHLMAEILLEQQLDGVRVRYMETLSRVTLGAFLALMFLNPARDAVRALKAQCERDDRQSVMDEMLAKLEADAAAGTVFGMNPQEAMRPAE